jgi:hypothetical protein
MVLQFASVHRSQLVEILACLVWQHADLLGKWSEEGGGCVLGYRYF